MAAHILIKDDKHRSSVKVSGLYEDIDAVSQKAFYECYNNIIVNSLNESDYKARPKFILNFIVIYVRKGKGSNF